MTRYTKLSLFCSVLTLLAITQGCSLPSAMMSKNSQQADAQSLERMISFARLQERHGKAGEATKLFQKVIEFSPENSMAHHRLGVIAAKTGNLEAAFAHFEQAKGDSPSPQLLGDIGYAHYLSGDHPQAEESFRQALKLNPELKGTRNNLGVVLAESKRYDEALEEFMLAGTEAQAFSNLAFIQSQHRDLRGAKENYLRALDLDSDLKPAAEALLQLAEFTGGLEKRQPFQPLDRPQTPGFDPSIEADSQAIGNVAAVNHQASLNEVENSRVRAAGAEQLILSGVKANTTSTEPMMLTHNKFQTVPKSVSAHGSATSAMRRLPPVKVSD
ncbi:MAG: Tfp pilus assembly protein PilF [Pirellulaceae bacterium]|jgi:Tfp pilus assembly protein PilF